MTYINPLAGAPLAGAQAQQQAATDKARQLRRAQTVARNIAADSDELEHQVENAEALSPVHDDARPKEQQPRQRSRKRPPPRGDRPDDGEQHIDVTA